MPLAPTSMRYRRAHLPQYFSTLQLQLPNLKRSRLTGERKRDDGRLTGASDGQGGEKTTWPRVDECRDNFEFFRLEDERMQVGGVSTTTGSYDGPKTTSRRLSAREDPDDESPRLLCGQQRTLPCELGSADLTNMNQFSKTNDELRLQTAHNRRRSTFSPSGSPWFSTTTGSQRYARRQQLVQRIVRNVGPARNGITERQAAA
ncbi:hypothetical protein C8F01DRAFT_1093025 [Mycena amicta]|nr:hypothetical protein C8F01DRAFT_1093025 [Mycena amicta]